MLTTPTDSTEFCTWRPFLSDSSQLPISYAYTHEIDDPSKVYNFARSYHYSHFLFYFRLQLFYIPEFQNFWKKGLTPLTHWRHTCGKTQNQNHSSFFVDSPHHHPCQKTIRIHFTTSVRPAFCIKKHSSTTVRYRRTKRPAI